MRKFNMEYKNLLTRVQRRYMIKDPMTPFEINQINNFLDKKERKSKLLSQIATKNYKAYPQNTEQRTRKPAPRP